MSNNLESAETLIQFQARVNALMTDLAVVLAKREKVTTATRMCEIRQYQSNTVFEACVDVETNENQSFSFWFEVGCADKYWHLAASISRNVHDGQDLLEEFPEFMTSNMNFDQLEKAGTKAINWLVKRAKEFDLDDREK